MCTIETRDDRLLLMQSADERAKRSDSARRRLHTTGSAGPMGKKRKEKKGDPRCGVAIWIRHLCSREMHTYTRLDPIHSTVRDSSYPNWSSLRCNCFQMNSNKAEKQVVKL